jgi:hypothetical protein
MFMKCFWLLTKPHILHLIAHRIHHKNLLLVVTFLSTSTE